MDKYRESVSDLITSVENLIDGIADEGCSEWCSDEIQTVRKKIDIVTSSQSSEYRRLKDKYDRMETVLDCAAVLYTALTIFNAFSGMHRWLPVNIFVLAVYAYVGFIKNGNN